MLSTTLWVQDHVVHHRPALCTIRWCTRWFCNIVIISDRDGAQCRGQPPHLTDIGPPCAPWCTMQVGGAQHRSMVCNVVLYSVGGAQRRSHKPTLTHSQTAPILWPRPLIWEVTTNTPCSKRKYTLCFVVSTQNVGGEEPSREIANQSSASIGLKFVTKSQVATKFQGIVYWEVTSESSQKSSFAIDFCVTGWQSACLQTLLYTFGSTLSFLANLCLDWNSNKLPCICCHGFYMTGFEYLPTETQSVCWSRVY